MGLQVGEIGLKTLLISRLRDSNYTLGRKLCKNNSLDSGFLLSENYHMPTENRIPLCSFSHGHHGILILSNDSFTSRYLM